MKKFSLLVIIVFFCSNLFPQWVQQNSGTDLNLYGVYFLNNSTGFAAGGRGASGIILKTVNGGNNWNTLLTSSQLIAKISFPSQSTGYIAAKDGFYKTTNSGLNFTFYSVPGLYCVACFFTSIDTGYFAGGTSYSNIYKTVNGGVNFTIITVTSVPNIIYDIYFTSTNTGFCTLGGTIYMTTNAGLNWTSKISGNFLRFSFPSPGIGYCGGWPSTVKTTDGGLNWTSLPNIPYLPYDEVFFSENVGYFGGGTNSGGPPGVICKTINGGINWQLQATIQGKAIEGMYFPSSGVGYAVGDSGLILKSGVIAALNDVYRYSDGRTQTINITFSDSNCVSSNGTIDSLWWYVNGIRQNPSATQPQHTMTFPFKQGLTFVQLKIKNSNGLTDSTTAKVVRAVYLTKTTGPIKAGLSLIGDDFLYSISTGNTVYRMTILGDTLYRLSTAGNILSSCSISYDTCVYICSDNTNLYGFTKSGIPIWTLPVYLGAPASCTPTIDSTSGRLYLGVENSKFYAINRQVGNIAWYYDTIDSPVRNSAVISLNRKLVFSSVAGTIYGFDLNNLPSPPCPKWKLNLNDSVFTSPAVDALGYFYFGTKSGKLVKVNLPASSTTGGIVWQTTLSGAVTSSPTIDANGNIYCGTSDGNFYCVKPGGGIKWNFLTTGAVRSTAAITNYARLYFGNDAGEFFGLDTNKNVQFYYKDSSKISCAILYKNAAAYLGTETGRLLAFYDTVEAGRGPGIPVWGTFQNNPQRTGNQAGITTIINRIGEIIADKYELYQNYPNPFNPITNIKYQLPKTNYVVLKIYDLLGREVATLINEKQSPGIYSIDFDGTMYASGIYFYKLTCHGQGDFTEVKKMILLK
jgi:photosystem II stability/assembly factor-like uncharacterized protein